MMPISHFGVGEIRLSERYTNAEKEIRIKKLVLDSVEATPDADGHILLHQESNERWYLDASRDWAISKLEVIENANAPPTTQALMHRALAGIPMAHSFLPMPECILPEAWIEGNCVPRQLAALLQIPISEIEWEFERQSTGWRETDGVSPEMLATF
jgi:hypothetical protein